MLVVVAVVEAAAGIVVVGKSLAEAAAGTAEVGRNLEEVAFEVIVD